MASASATDIMTRAMVKARVLYPGETLPSNKSDQMFEELNDLLEMWSLDKLMVVADVEESFALTAGTARYTYGTGGDFDSDRPIYIKNESYFRGGGRDYPVTVVPSSEYRRRYDKDSQGTPREMSYLPEFPLGIVNIWPSPSSSDTLYIKASKTVTEFSDKTTDVSLQPGYSAALVTNLAVQILPNFGKKVPRSLAALAAMNLGKIKQANRELIKTVNPVDLAAMTGGSRGNIIEGPYR